jgi:hypothetical protein
LNSGTRGPREGSLENGGTKACDLSPDSKAHNPRSRPLVRVTSAGSKCVLTVLPS